MRGEARRTTKVLWIAPLLLIVGASAGSGSLAGVTSLLIDSEPDEFIGEGQFNFYTPDDGTLELHPFNPSSDQEVHLVFRGQFGVAWVLDFAPPPGEAMAVGSYEDAVTLSVRGPGQPGLHINSATSGIGRFCINASGRFEVKQIGLDAEGVLARFWATFEQTCLHKVLRGEVRFNADVPVVLRAPSRRTAAAGRELSFEVQGLDTSGNPVALAATAPDGASFSDAGDGTGRFAWTPAEGGAVPFWMAFRGESAGGEADVVYTRLEVIPDFDDFDHPIPFATLPFESMVYEPQAGRAPDDPACPNRSQSPMPPSLPGPERGSVWYSFTPVEDGGVHIWEQERFVDGPPVGPIVAVYTGERGALEPRACGGSAVRLTAVAGTTYHIKVEVAPASRIKLSAVALPPPPPNDDFDAATVVGSLPFSEAIDTRGALAGLDEPKHCPPGSGIGPGFGGIGPSGSLPPAPGTNVWYAYTPSEDMRVTVDSAGSNYTPMITAFSGERGALVPLDCDRSRLSFTALAGRTYHLMIDGALSSFADRLQVSFTGKPALRIEVAVDGFGAVVPRSGAALVHGIARCSRPARIVIEGTLRQARRGGVQGDFEAVVACAGATPWRAEVAPDGPESVTPRFSSGPALLSFHAEGVPGDNPDDLAIDSGHSPINLKIAPRR